jgi:hypothetical protein
MHIGSSEQERLALERLQSRVNELEVKQLETQQVLERHRLYEEVYIYIYIYIYYMIKGERTLPVG